MGLLTRLRAWLFGGDEDDEAADAPADTAEPRLDPDNVTETRSDSAEDAVERLRSISAREDGEREDEAE